MHNMSIFVMTIPTHLADFTIPSYLTKGTMMSWATRGCTRTV